MNVMWLAMICCPTQMRSICGPCMTACQPITYRLRSPTPAETLINTAADQRFALFRSSILATDKAVEKNCLFVVEGSESEVKSIKCK